MWRGQSTALLLDIDLSSNGWLWVPSSWSPLEVDQHQHDAVYCWGDIGGVQVAWVCPTLLESHQSLPQPWDWSISLAPLAPWDSLWERESELSDNPGVNILYVIEWPFSLLPPCTQEGWVTKGTSQRRAGLHVDCPGAQVRPIRAVEKKDSAAGRVNIKSLPKEAENIKREGVDTKQGEDGFCVEGGGDSQPFDYHGWGLGCCHYITHINEENTFRLIPPLQTVCYSSCKKKVSSVHWEQLRSARRDLHCLQRGPLD